MINLKRTKIVATIGPASESPEILHAFIQNGVNVFRFNMKHNAIKWHEKRIARVQKIADGLGKNIAILIDLQGPEIRIKTRGGSDLIVSKGQKVFLSDSFEENNTELVLPSSLITETLERGDSILIDDGFVRLKVVEKRARKIMAKVIDGGVIQDRKGTNLPGKSLKMPSLLEEDLKRLDLATRQKVDFVALSFVRDANDIQILREEIEKRQIDAQIVAKIENAIALKNLDAIITSSDAIMVARGDLGVEVPIEELAHWQKKTITQARLERTPVIVATEMLDSMIRNPRPTRAEATDVANAVYDGADALMLSGETATGKYPIKAVQVMDRIARFNEVRAQVPQLEQKPLSQTEMVVDAAMRMLRSQQKQDYHIDAALVFTETGHTARVLSSLRPKLPIIGITNSQKTVEQLSISYGVTGFYIKFPSGEFQPPIEIITKLKNQNLLSVGNRVLIIHGRQWQQAGATNTVSVLEVE